ncbi:auxin efflux carrier [Patellaria atrata CBS 101060]|uniref:Auxin efflux carrier n=1 Tax=Patellaria atrata CBS 101060 TaxID=1346257 RepID=A0A9P4SIU1_9PEZI|nr:auxin efflux carrier [Patellaria atrata CBS 101060]
MAWSFFSTPTSYRLAQTSNFAFESTNLLAMTSDTSYLDGFRTKLAGHSSHPDFGHLVLLVFEAVLEVVCVSLPGYIVARQGMFDADAQKFLANLNVQLFTPCLIFTKLASQLTADKLVELAVIPFIFILQTAVSFMGSWLISKAFKFTKRQSNFVIAMGVFGNSNSLPISLVISLSKTLNGLHWDKIPGDNDDEVAARGILYLLIFQQLGQLVRWSWGYHVLLAPADSYKEEDEGRHSAVEQGRYGEDSGFHERQYLLDSDSDSDSSEGYTDINDNAVGQEPVKPQSDSDYESGSVTPVNKRKYASGSSKDGDSDNGLIVAPTNGNIIAKGPGSLANHNFRQDSAGHITSFPVPTPNPSEENLPSGLQGWWLRIKQTVVRFWSKCTNAIRNTSNKAFDALPTRVQKILSKIGHWLWRFLHGLWEFMNPPLWAMFAAIIVASIPPLQHLFFQPGTFINNSVTRAISQSGGVAVPLILVVLGANLARNTLPKDAQSGIEDPKVERNLLIASILSRMLIPTLLMSPFIAIIAKYVPVSILDDPIFVIVVFLLTGAPSALQLAQICQINNVYMGAMSRLLFQSYVVWILPSTLVLVMLALEVVEWAA